jgi:predicted short-subunit dehydrogenase-like oxidoreductase (DUF2520 family)
MKVLIIGAGNVATVLARLSQKAGHQIIQVVSRSISSAKVLADELKCPYTNDFNHLDSSADFYLVAMSDAALNGLQENIRLKNQLIVHTAGAISKDVLQLVSTNFGVLYPLQSLRKEEKNDALQIPLLVDGNNETSSKMIAAFANSISRQVQIVSEEDRKKLHVAAVVVNNFTNYLFTLASDYCKAEHVSFDLLYPLIDALVSRLHHHNPAEMQTGPALRKDTVTLEKHLRLLQSHPKLKSIYLKMSDSIMNG